MEEPRFVALSVLLALVWGGTVLAWVLHAAKDRARRVSALVMIGFALVLGPIAFSKNGGDPPLRSGAAASSPPVVSLLLAEIRTNAAFDLSMPSNAVVHGPWLLRGSSDDWFWLHSTDDLFRAGSNAFRSVRVSSRGTLAFPDGSRLEPFHAVLGVPPEPNWTNAPTRAWHAPAAGGGRLFTWENAALERDPATPVSFQAELRPDGGMVGRYDLPHPATNFVIAAFGESALSVRGDVTNAATVRRANGATIPETSLAELLRDATRFELVWRAADGDPDADPDGDGLSTRDEIRHHGTDPKQADTDGDGLSDASEILLGSNPLDADEDDDGVPDGFDSTGWTTNPLWAVNSTNDANVTILLAAPIPTNAAATLLVGDLAIPLREPASWSLYLEPGQLYPYRLFVSDGATASLSITNGVPAPPMRGSVPWGHGPPLWESGSGHVFDLLSAGGEGELAIPLAELHWDNPGDGSHASGNDVCVHVGNEAVFTPSLLPAVAGNWTLDGFTRRGVSFVLCVPGDGEVHSATATLGPGILRFGEIALTAYAHRSDATHEYPWCSCCLCYEALDCELVPSKRLLTLKHDNEAYLDVIHTNSSWIPLEDVVVDIRRFGEDEWKTLGPATNLLPWTARVAGMFELRARGIAEGIPFTTPIEEIEVQFPSVYEIMGDATVQARALQEWNATLADCTEVPLRRRERGYWILLDTASDTYGTWTNCYGGWVVPGTNASVRIPPPDADIPENPLPTSPGAIYPVAWFHTHTPTTYITNDPPQIRWIAPSDADRRLSVRYLRPGIFYDFDPDPNSPPDSIPMNWPKNSPASMRPILPPERRYTP